MTKRKKKVLLAFQPAILFLGIYPSKMKTYVHIKTYVNMYNGFTHNSPKLETTQAFYN